MNTKDTRPVFIYWDNSNIYIEAQRLAQEKEGSEVQYRMRIKFDSLFELAHAGRSVSSAYAAGSVPPQLSMLWNRLENAGFKVKLQQRGEYSRREQGVDQELQLQMLQDGLDNNGDPGIIVLLTGDGSGFSQGEGFHATLERLYKRGWGIEVLSWQHSCNKAMREWTQKVGVFVALDDFYEQITFLEPPQPGETIGTSREAAPLDLTNRETV